MTEGGNKDDCEEKDDNSDKIVENNRYEGTGRVTDNSCLVLK